jgi:hypothetical protein
METHYSNVDVLVIGGGTAGVIAALQAARAGAKTAIIEMNGQLGGTMTTGGVNAPAYFFSPERQIIAGIGWELVLKTKALDNTPWPDFSRENLQRPSYHIPINPAVYALIAEEACLDAGIDLHYHEILAAVNRAEEGRPTDGAWTVQSVGKGLVRRTTAHELIDCTGDADVVGLLGLPRERGDVRQPGTLEFRFGGYDIGELDVEIVQEHFETAMQEGDLQPGDFWLAEDRLFIDFLRNGGHNQQHIFGADSSTSRTQTAANIEGRRAALRLLRFIRGLPGCEQATLEQLHTMAAIRETYRIVGETTITYDDYISGRVFDDAVCNSLYFIDVHTEHGVEHEFVPAGRVPTVPLGALIPKGSEHLLVAGRAVASDRLANSALRVEASCMAMGQAAGAAAALGVKLETPSRNVPIAEIRDLLAEHDAIVPGLEGDNDA